MFFALDGCGDCGEALKVDELVDVVFCCVGFGVDFGFVFGDSVHQVCGHAYVKPLEAACHDVDVGELVRVHSVACWLFFGVGETTKKFGAWAAVAKCGDPSVRSG